MNVQEFIQSNIDKTTKFCDGAVEEDTLIALPYPFTTPCIEGMFQEMYYWDTYFTQKALYLTGRGEQAVHNIKNFSYLLNTYGKIPNGNRTYYLKGSQPPFFGLMLSDAMNQRCKDIDIRCAFEDLEKEYSFWMNYRQSANGLNHYDIDMENAANSDTIRWYKDRTGILLENTEENCRCIWSEGESGWDFSPRFHSAGIYHNAVDLNCLLYADERLLSVWATMLGCKEVAEKYADLAKKRKSVMEQTMRTEDGVWYDYNYVTGKRSDIISCAAFFPYFIGIDMDVKSFLKILEALERTYGIAASLTPRRTYQWAEPNGWAPLQYIACVAADKIGLKEDACRLAKKYVCATDEIFERTERLWEKYNVETGTMEVTSEYGTPEMLGWTAGVYMAFSSYLETGKII